MTLDIPTLIRFLRPALAALLGMVPAGTPAYFLAQLALTLLGQFQAAGAHASFRATPPVALPPEHEWTPDGIAAWAQQQVDDGA